MWRMDRYRPRSQNMRLLALGMFLIGLTAGYLRVVRHFRVTELPSERHFGPPGPVKPAGEVYLEPIGIDALNDAMQMRAYLSPSISNSKNARTASDRGDLTLLVTHDDTVEEVKLAAADHLATSTFEGDLNKGSVTHYPLDSYRHASSSNSSRESPHSGSRLGSQCGKECSATNCIRQANPDPRMTLS
jgi:hypothetical protein